MQYVPSQVHVKSGAYAEVNGLYTLNSGLSKTKQVWVNGNRFLFPEDGGWVLYHDGKMVLASVGKTGLPLGTMWKDRVGNYLGCTAVVEVGQEGLMTPGARMAYLERNEAAAIKHTEGAEHNVVQPPVFNSPTAVLSPRVGNYFDLIASPQVTIPNTTMPHPNVPPTPVQKHHILEEPVASSATAVLAEDAVSSHESPPRPLSELRNYVATLEAKASEQQETISAMQARIDSQETELSACRVESVKRQIVDAQTSITAHSSPASSTQSSRIDALESQHAAELSDLKATIKALRDAQRAHEEQRIDHEQTVLKLQSENKWLADDAEGLKASLDKATQENIILMNEKKKLEATSGYSEVCVDLGMTQEKITKQI
eukprot:TRINITY_DN18032_c0_g1_i2.p1 TRINITY_DN18032_c0_g1~~TRINITY_DN18032_c0_g1_i2.p1  ORF type:complete len:372 (+),score=57.03 TRINITY_DN18032_c0_g1_i2:241-1356(+)